MNKVLKAFSFIVIFLFVLSLFGWMVFHLSMGDKNFGFLNGPIKFMYTFPDLLNQSVEEVKTLPGTFIPTPEGFEPINKLEDDFIVLSTYSDTNESRTIVLLNLKNDSVLYKWTLENQYPEHARIMNPLLYPEKSLVYSFGWVSGLKRIDSLTNVIWQQDSIYAHHSLTTDRNGDIWACTNPPVWFATGMYELDGRTVFYIDNYVTKINAVTGKIMFHKSFTDILKDNNLEYYILKSMTIKDPIHLNDIEAAFKTTTYYQEDDLFISARSASLVLHYRPSTNKVIKIIEGPFTSQHDVDFLNDSSLVIFNNNYYNIKSEETHDPPLDSIHLKNAGDFYSNIVRYDLWNDSISFIGDSVFRANEIHTLSEGLMEFIDPATYLVEEQNTGIIWIIKIDTLIYKNVLRSQHEGYHHLPNWIRIINNYE